MGGMELLARLRAQRGGPAPPPPGGGGNGAAAAADTRDASVNGMLNATPTPSTVSAAFNVERTVSVDVCGGVDCAGHGGGACLIEMEELSREHPTVGGCALTVQRSPCMRLCGHGPAVRLHVISDEWKNGETLKAAGAPAPGFDGDAEGKSWSGASCASLQRTLAVEHLTHVQSPADCRRVLEVAREMSDKTSRMRADRPDEWRGLEEDAALSSLQWQPSDARAAGGSGEPAIDIRTSLMTRRAENMRWEALKVITRRDGEKKGKGMLMEANQADANLARMIDGKVSEEGKISGGRSATTRAARRAARLAELTARPVAEPLPSEGAVEGGVKEILAGMAAVRTT